MKYAIWSINDKRLHYKERISSTVGFEQVLVPTVDGSQQGHLMATEINNGFYYDEPKPLTLGERGVWQTFINNLKTTFDVNDNVLHFEDDALLHPDFMNEFDRRFSQVPEDFDFFSLFIPRDHDKWFTYRPKMNEDGMILDGMYAHEGLGYNQVNESIFRPWQRYGGVSMVWSPKGAAKALDLIHERPYGQWDEFVYANSRLGKLNGFTSNPTKTDLVYITGSEESLVH